MHFLNVKKRAKIQILFLEPLQDRKFVTKMEDEIFLPKN